MVLVVILFYFKQKFWKFEVLEINAQKLDFLHGRMLQGKDTPHDYVFWSKAPSFSGVQYNLGYY